LAQTLFSGVSGVMLTSQTCGEQHGDTDAAFWHRVASGATDCLHLRAMTPALRCLIAACHCPAPAMRSNMAEVAAALAGMVLENHASLRGALMMLVMLQASLDDAALVHAVSLTINEVKKVEAWAQVSVRATTKALRALWGEQVQGLYQRALKVVDVAAQVGRLEPAHQQVLELAGAALARVLPQHGLGDLLEGVEAALSCVAEESRTSDAVLVALEAPWDASVEEVTQVCTNDVILGPARGQK